jgi:hypothetical protein
MLDFKPIVDALIKSAPTAVYVALVGILWQIVYAIVKDRLARKEALEKLKLETERFAFQSKAETLRFEHQRTLEKEKFEYEKLKWREQLSLELAKRHLDARLKTYPPLWGLVRAVARHSERSGALTPDESKALAKEIEAWRYSKGGLLAEETTRDAALALQSALWKYNSTSEGFVKIRRARRLVRASLRADMGLGANSEGENIFDATAARQHIAEELAALQRQLDIRREAPAG